MLETDAAGTQQRWYVHGLSYIDERVMMMKGPGDSSDRPYYYIQDRLYNVWAMVDRAGAIVERYAYDPYGLPLVRESAGRGDCDNDTDLDSTDSTRVTDLKNGTKWDPRADMDDYGDVDGTDQSLWTTKSTP